MRGFENYFSNMQIYLIKYRCKVKKVRGTLRCIACFFIIRVIHIKKATHYVQLIYKFSNQGIFQIKIPSSISRRVF